MSRAQWAPARQVWKRRGKAKGLLSTQGPGWAAGVLSGGCGAHWFPGRRRRRGRSEGRTGDGRPAHTGPRGQRTETLTFLEVEKLG